MSVKINFKFKEESRFDHIKAGEYFSPRAPACSNIFVYQSEWFAGRHDFILWCVSL